MLNGPAKNNLKNDIFINRGRPGQDVKSVWAKEDVWAQIQINNFSHTVTMEATKKYSAVKLLTASVPASY